ncbi:hypothetical protein [Streptomyces sp. 142MFCol3.1]
MTATKDADHSEAAVLAEWLNENERHRSGVQAARRGRAGCRW